uniref:Uncharacterized protein n=1 Tax=Arundo donax TaxID=35708 RepID=A0A0A9GCV6_ARUDO
MCLYTRHAISTTFVSITSRMCMQSCASQVIRMLHAQPR